MGGLPVGDGAQAEGDEVGDQRVGVAARGDRRERPDERLAQRAGLAAGAQGAARERLDRGLQATSSRAAVTTRSRVAARRASVRSVGR
jgi:hypothetical protein